MASYYRDGSTWTVSFRIKGFPRDYLYGIKSESLAQKAAEKKSLEEQLARADLHTANPKAEKYAKALGQSIDAHVQAFKKSIVSRGKSEQHAHQQAAHVSRLLKMARVSRLNRITAEAIQSAARSLLDQEKLSARTCNAALQATQQFGRWLKKTERWESNVLADALERFAETEKRRPRRELSDEEIDRVIDAAETAKRTVGKQLSLSGPDRAMLYRVALYTGFRQGACVELEKSAFHVDPQLTRPFVRLPARFNKNRKDRDQPIPRDFAAVLHEWLSTRSAGKVWRVPPHAARELWMRRDMDAARAAWISEAKTPQAKAAREQSDFLRYQDSQGRFADFHGWRHTGISRVVRHAGLKAGQVWADHSSPVITAKYAHLSLMDETKSLEALPPATKPAPKKGRKTG